MVDTEQRFSLFFLWRPLSVDSAGGEIVKRHFWISRRPEELQNPMELESVHVLGFCVTKRVSVLN